MSEIAHSFFSQVPWLKTFLAWAFGAAVVLAVLAIPAYYLFAPITNRLREDIARYFGLLREQHRRNVTERLDAERNLISRFSEDRLLRQVDMSGDRLWGRTQATLFHLAREIQANLSGVTGRISEFTKALPRLHEGLALVSNSIPKDITFPTADGTMTRSIGTLRVARMALICASLLLIAIVFVNTGMLSQIIRDLGFIPPSLKFAGIQLFYVLAFLITCVEAGLGLVHGVFTDHELREEQSKIHIGGALVTVFAGGIACVEGFFYSRIIPTRTETVTLPIIGYTLPQTDIFFIWGFLLVTTLFSLGIIVYRMGARVLRGTALTSVQKQLRTITKEAIQCSTALQRTELLSASARDAIASEEGKGQPKPFAEAVERLVSEIHKLTSARPPWANVVEQPVGTSEVIHLSRYALLWVGIAAGAVVLVRLTGVAGFTALGRVTAPSLYALVEAIVAATAGFMIAWRETIVQGTEWQKVVAPVWARFIGL